MQNIRINPLRPLIQIAIWSLRFSHAALVAAYWSALIAILEVLLGLLDEQSVTAPSIIRMGPGLFYRQEQAGRACRWSCRQVDRAGRQFWQALAAVISFDRPRRGPARRQAKARAAAPGTTNTTTDTGATNQQGAGPGEIVLTLIQSPATQLYLGPGQQPTPGAVLMGATASVQLSSWSSRPARPGELEDYLAAGRRPQVQLWYAA